MSRPSLSTLKDIEMTGESWDADVDDNFDDVKTFVEDQPIAVKYYATESSLPAAGSFDDCLAIVQNHTTHGFCIAVSNGTAWKFVALSLS